MIKRVLPPIVAGPLKTARRHDLEKVSNLQAVSRYIGTDIGRHNPFLEGRINALKVCGLVAVRASVG